MYVLVIRMCHINIDFVRANNFESLFKKKKLDALALIFIRFISIGFIQFFNLGIKKVRFFCMIITIINSWMQNCVCHMERQERVSCNCAVTRGNCEAANLASAIQLSGVKDLAATTALTGANAINP